MNYGLILHNSIIGCFLEAKGHNDTKFIIRLGQTAYWAWAYHCTFEPLRKIILYAYYNLVYRFLSKKMTPVFWNKNFRDKQIDREITVTSVLPFHFSFFQPYFQNFPHKLTYTFSKNENNNKNMESPFIFCGELWSR